VARRQARLWIRAIGRLTVVEFVSGELIFEEDTVRDLGQRLQDLVEEGHVRLLLNLEGVECACGSLLAHLTWLHLRVRAARGFLKIYGLEPVLHDAIRICHLDRVLEICADQEEALGAGSSEAERPFREPVGPKASH
jgi:anti-anti-sigma regulatory factor